MKTLKNYILDRLSSGKHFFSKQEALDELRLTQDQFRHQAYRLAQKRALKKLTNTFYMIIPPEYQHLGSLPPLWIIDALMKHLGQDYYIGLLSAASLYGATEQQPMVFQVITNKDMKPIDLERMKIEFHSNKLCNQASITMKTIPTGYASVSSREQTMVDLIRFYKASGYLSNVALVIKALAEESVPLALIQVLKKERTKPVLQRLGYIFELAKLPQLAKLVEDELTKRNIEYVFLKPDFHIKAGKRSKRWKLIINDSLEFS